MNGFPVWSTSTVRPFGSEATKCAFATSATASLQVCVPTVRPASCASFAIRTHSVIPPARQASGWTTSSAPARIISRKPWTPKSFSPAASGHVDLRAQARVEVDLLRRERLLEPEDPARGELAAHPHRPLEAVAVRAVDDHVIPLARTAPRRVDRGQVVLGVAPEPHLHPPEAVRDMPRGLGLELVDVVRPEEPARVGGAAVRRGAEQLPDRRTLLLAAQVPERDVEAADRGDRRSLAAVPARQVVEPAPEPLRLGRVAADQVRREVLLDDRLDEVGMAVGGPDPRLAAVGLDAGRAR